MQWHLLGVSSVWGTFHEQFDLILSDPWDRQGHYCHPIIDRETGTENCFTLRNQGLGFWPMWSDQQSSCPWPCKWTCTSHGPADLYICSFPSEGLISVTGHVPFPSFLTLRHDGDRWGFISVSGSHYACLLNEYTFTWKKRALFSPVMDMLQDPQLNQL